MTKTQRRDRFFTRIQHASPLDGGRTLIIVDGDPGRIEVGDSAAFGELTCPRGMPPPKARVIRRVGCLDRPLSWGLEVDGEIDEFIGANIGASLMITPSEML
ncbi:hypothetical protein KUL25_20670 [Rhodobacteraceae bacterium N5(2021)]|uniref:Uncharacterized protein n=1 Tax=Gymnodinialimonas phycosphaerae TaxID=2841589 RepID=A0A975YFW5_9RHOB|nr:hypothetical protein [Gymnodinialimonas phycosphaerae]MBY4895183.1 hypothetical protein [Gymnodinialimonas phycosphaerae]